MNLLSSERRRWYVLAGLWLIVIVRGAILPGPCGARCRG